jgi:hypothetical protein
MNKRLNTVFFVIGATIFNLFSMAVIFIALFMLYARFIGPALSPRMNQFLTLWLFFGSVALAYWVYSRIIRWAEQRVDFHKYLEPIFARKQHGHGPAPSARQKPAGDAAQNNGAEPQGTKQTVASGGPDAAVTPDDDSDSSAAEKGGPAGA